MLYEFVSKNFCNYFEYNKPHTIKNKDGTKYNDESVYNNNKNNNENNNDNDSKNSLKCPPKKIPSDIFNINRKRHK